MSERIGVVGNRKGADMQQVCLCHGEPMGWNKDPRKRSGGHWYCRIKQRERVRLWALANGERKRQSDRRWHEAHPEYGEKRSRRSALRKYGLTPKDYDEILLAQKGVCAICGNECSTGKRLAVDHDHRTGRIRGLLCLNCNHGLGKLGDDPERLLAAADYLRARGSV